MSDRIIFADPRLTELDGFAVTIDEANERADIVLDNPPYNPDEWPVTEEELAIMTEGLGLVGLTDVDMPSGRKVVDQNSPVAQLMRNIESALDDGV